MDELTKLISELSIDSFDKKTTYLIEVTYIANPFRFFVRPVKYKPIIKMLETTEPTIKAANVKIDDLVMFNLGYSCGGRKYIRGRVIRLVEMEDYVACDVLAVDYGFIEKCIPLEETWECSELMQYTDPLALDCQLANCYPINPDGFTSMAVNNFKYLAGFDNLNMRIVDMKQDKYLVDLINSTPESIATLLVIRGCSMLDVYNSKATWKPIVGRKILRYKFNNLSIGEKLHVKLLSGTTLKSFQVAIVDDYKEHLRETNVLTFYAKREFAVLPAHFFEGTLVCVKINDVYARGFIKKVVTPLETAIVQLVDLGLDGEFPITQMKYMPVLCLRTPVLAIACRCDEDQAWDNGVEGFLHLNFEFHIKIKKLGHEFESPFDVDISDLEDDKYDEARALPLDNIDE